MFAGNESSFNLCAKLPVSGFAATAANFPRNVMLHSWLECT